MKNYIKLNRYIRRLKLTILVIMQLLFISFLGTTVSGSNTFQISGYYLGGTPEELGVRLEDDEAATEKYYETEANDAHLYFIRVRERLRLYRIIKEEAVDAKNIKVILDNLKEKYGPPDRQQIKTSSTRPRFQSKYVTTIKNRAIWNISTSQEFVAEIESQRVMYELIDHDPENIEAAKKPGSSEEQGFGSENWDPDY